MILFSQCLIRWARGHPARPANTWSGLELAHQRVFLALVMLAMISAHAPLQTTMQLGGDTYHGFNVYEKACSMCHGRDGSGRPPYGPSLEGSLWLRSCRADHVAAIILDGIHGPIPGTNAPYPVMPALRSWLSNEEIATVSDYVLARWSNRGDRVRTSEVQAWRELLPARLHPWSLEELRRIARPVMRPKENSPP